MTVNKETIAKTLKERLGLKNMNEATAAVNGVFDIVNEALERGEDVKIVGHGSHTFKDMPESVKRNPSNGKSVTVPAHKKHNFKLSKEIKETAKKA